MKSAAFDIDVKLNAPIEEAYRALRTNIQFCGYEKKIRTMAITSCYPGEGKTTTAINLAISMAKADMKVLLVDTDLRKPMLAKQLKCKNSHGLTNLIYGIYSLDEVINSTDIPNFFYIASGPKPPNPAEIIASTCFSEFVKTIVNDFDIVIFDTPPLGSVIDCAIVSAQTDGTLIVMEPNTVEYKMAHRVKEQLEKANARVLGVVLNKIRRAEYKKYYGRYNYYEETKSVEWNWKKRARIPEKAEA